MAKLIDITGKALSGEWGLDDDIGNGIPVLRTTNFTNEGIVNYNSVVTRQINKKDLSKKFLRKGDIIIEKSGGSDKQPVGRVVFFDGEEEKYLFNNFTGLLRVANQEKWVPRYVFYSLFANYIQGGTRRFENKTTGLHNLKTDNYVESTEVKEIPHEEQLVVVEQLDRVIELITLRKQQVAKLDELGKARFVELFGSAKHNHQGYPVVKIGSCAKLQGGFAFKSSDYLDDGIRLVQISNVNKDTLDWDSINCVPQSFLQKYKDFELHVGDLVLAMTRPVIKSLDAVKIATVSEDDVPSLLNQRVGRFVIDKAKLNSLYLMLSCQMSEFREYVEAMSGNSLQPNISSKQVEDYSIVLPPLALQEQFAVFVEQTDKSKLAIQQSLDKLETLKKSLMQKYFG